MRMHNALKFSEAGEGRGARPQNPGLEARRISLRRRQAASSTLRTPASPKSITAREPARLSTTPGPKERCTTAVPGR